MDCPKQPQKNSSESFRPSKFHVKAKEQFKQCLETCQDEELKTIIKSGPQVNQRRRDRTNLKLADQIFGLIEDQTRKPAESSDNKIYDALRELVHKGQQKKTAESEGAYNVSTHSKQGLLNRGDKHARAIVDILGKVTNYRPRSLLDIGCAEGSITLSLMEKWDIPKERTHGCDVTPLIVKNDSGFFLFIFVVFFF